MKKTEHDLYNLEKINLIDRNDKFGNKYLIE